MTHPRNNSASHASVTPDTVSELLTMVTHAEKPWSDFFAQVLSAVMLLVQINMQGVAPRRVKDAIGSWCGFQIPAMEVSRAV